MFPNHALRNAIEEYFQQVFNAHRRAIRKSISRPEDLGSNAALLRTIDALMQCSLLMNADLNTECVLRQIMDEAKALVGAEAASVFLLDSSRQNLYSTVNSTGRGLQIPVTCGIAGHVATTGESVVIQDAYHDKRFNKSVDVRTGFKTQNMMCVPLRSKRGRIIGVVQLINKTQAGLCARVREGMVSEPAEVSAAEAAESTSGFMSDDLHFLQVFASQAATAIGNDSGSERSSPPWRQRFESRRTAFMLSRSAAQRWCGPGALPRLRRTMLRRPGTIARARMSNAMRKTSSPPSACPGSTAMPTRTALTTLVFA
jgi:hypothetical protein